MFPIATASTPADPVVFREAISQMRSLPLASTYVAFCSLTHFASEEGRSTTEVTLGVPVEDAIVTLLTRSTSGEVRLRLVLWRDFFGRIYVLARDIVRLVRGVNIGL